MFDQLWNWLKQNIVIGVLILVALLLVLFPRAVRRMFAAPRKRRRRTRSGKPLPRSVGTRRRRRTTAPRARTTGSGYAAAGGGTIALKYNKDGTVKKAWQVKGTVAAKQRMARLRRSR